MVIMVRFTRSAKDKYESAEEYLDRHFPKGDNRRGEAMVILALAKSEMKGGKKDGRNIN